MASEQLELIREAAVYVKSRTKLVPEVGVILGTGLGDFANALLSWFQPRPSHPILDVLENISDFVCRPVRRMFPTAMGGIDFAPLIVLLIIQFVGMGFLVPTLADLARTMR